MSADSCHLCGKSGELDEFPDGFAIMHAHKACYYEKRAIELEERCFELEEANSRLMNKLYNK
jgi:hypothetical protein